MQDKSGKLPANLEDVVQYIVSVAETIETEDPIDWGMLAIDERSTYKMIATSVIENYYGTPEQGRDMMMLSMLTKLVVENLVLNLILLQCMKARK